MMVVRHVASTGHPDYPCFGGNGCAIGLFHFKPDTVVGFEGMCRFKQHQVQTARFEQNPATGRDRD
jgi:hypothetical protein